MTLPNTMPNALRSLADQIDDLEYSQGQYKEIAERFRAERDDLQHRFEFLQNDFNQLYLEYRDGTLRIITADELKVGMWAAWRHRGKWWVEVIERDYSYSDIDGPCILLADAPPQEPEPARRGRVLTPAVWHDRRDEVMQIIADADATLSYTGCQQTAESILTALGFECVS